MHSPGATPNMGSRGGNLPRVAFRSGDLENLIWRLPLAALRGGRWRDHGQVLNGIFFRGRTGCPGRDVSERYGPYQTLYKWFARWGEDGTWARIEKMLQADALAAGDLDLAGHVDSTVVRARQHAAAAVKGGAPQMNHVRRRDWARRVVV